MFSDTHSRINQTTLPLESLERLFLEYPQEIQRSELTLFEVVLTTELTEVSGQETRSPETSLSLDTHVPKDIVIGHPCSEASSLDTHLPKTLLVDTHVPKTLLVDTHVPKDIVAGHPCSEASLDTHVPKTLLVDTHVPKDIVAGHPCSEASLDTHLPNIVGGHPCSEKTLLVDTHVPKDIVAGHPCSEASSLDTHLPKTLLLDTHVSKSDPEIPPRFRDDMPRKEIESAPTDNEAVSSSDNKNIIQKTKPTDLDEEAVNFFMGFMFPTPVEHPTLPTHDVVSFYSNSLVATEDNTVNTIKQPALAIPPELITEPILAEKIPAAAILPLISHSLSEKTSVPLPLIGPVSTEQEATSDHNLPDTVPIIDTADLNKLKNTDLKISNTPSTDIEQFNLPVGLPVAINNWSEYPQPVERAALSVPINASLSAPEWGHEMAEKITWLFSQRHDSANLQLDPPELGPLLVKIVMQPDSTQLFFGSEHQEVRQAVEQSLPQLHEMMQDLGMPLISVEVAAHFSESSLMKEQQQSFSQSGRIADIDKAETVPETVTLRPYRSDGLIDIFV